MSWGEGKKPRLVLPAVVGLALGALWAPATAGAAVFNPDITIDEYADPGPGTGCSLREAIEAANTDGTYGGCTATDAGDDTINLDAGATYVRTRTGADDTNVNGDLDVLNENITINGHGATIQGSDTLAGDRVIESHEGLAIFEVTLRDGFSSGISADGGGARLNATEVDDYLNLFQSTVTSNHADGFGGGLANLNGSEFFVWNSTVSGNTANADSGGVDTNRTGAFGGDVNLTNSTVTNNTAGADTTGGSGGGLGVFVGFHILRNSIVAGNFDASPATFNAPDCFEDPTGAGSGVIGSLGYSLIGNTNDCGYGAGTGDVLNVPAGLGPLASNPPGVTQTHALLPGSPAIDAGNPAMSDGTSPHCEPVDQRDVMRPVGPRCDIGAFETTVSPTAPPGLTTPPSSTPSTGAGTKCKKKKKRKKTRGRAVAAKKKRKGCKKKKKRK